MSTRDNVKGIFSLFELMGDELDELMGDLPSQQVPVRVPAYGKIYDISFGKVIGYVFQTCGILEEMIAIAQSKEPHLRMVEFARTAKPSLNLESPNIWPLLCSWIVMWKTLEAISVFGRSIHKLISDASTGDDEALFAAIYIDRSVLNSDYAAQRISTAEIAGDGEFFEKLAKAIKRSRPTRPRERLDEVRLLLAIVDEMVGLDSVTSSELTEWATELELYPVDADALQAISRQRRKFQELSSH